MPNKKARGYRAKTRAIRKGPKVTANKILFPFKIGNIVDIMPDTSVKSGMPFRRFQGLTGPIVGKQGTAFYVKVHKMNKEMKVLCGPAHINLSKGVAQQVSLGDDEAEIKTEKKKVKVSA